MRPGYWAWTAAIRFDRLAALALMEAAGIPPLCDALALTCNDRYRNNRQRSEFIIADQSTMGSGNLRPELKENSIGPPAMVHCGPQ